MNISKAKIVITLLLFSLMLTGFSSPEEQWPTFQGNEKRTGYSESTLPDSPQVLWQKTKGDFKNLGLTQFETNHPVIYDKNVFFAVQKVLAFNSENGALVWSYQDNDAQFFPHGITAGEDKIFVTVNNSNNLKEMSAGFVYALSQNKGEFLWKYQTKEPISHSLPLFYDNKIFIGDDSATIYSLSADDGSLIWQKQLEADGDIHASPAHADSLVIITTEGDAIHKGETGEIHASHSSAYALDANTGEIKWQFPIDYLAGRINLIHSTPSIDGSVVYFGAENGYFYAVSLNTGELIWKTQLVSDGSNLVGSSGSAGIGLGKVFVGTWVNKFFALDQKTGEKAWEFPFAGSGTDSSPVVADEKVCFGVHDGYFYCLNAETGKEVWKKELGGSSASLAEGTLFVTNAQVGAESADTSPVIMAFSEKEKSLSDVKDNNLVTYFIIGLGVIILIIGIYSFYRSKKKS